MEPFHKRLKELRLDQRLSIREIAKQINVPESTYREWEYGRSLAGPPYVKLAKVLAIPLSTLMTGEASDTAWIADELKEVETMLFQLRSKAIPRL